MIENDMTAHRETLVRHTLRPLNVFTYCGQPTVGSRAEYLRATRHLPPCPDCQRARDRVMLMLQPKRRLLSATRAAGSSATA
jgi:hypothetical protein